jgi:hypothetical protein
MCSSLTARVVVLLLLVSSLGYATTASSGSLDDRVAQTQLVEEITAELGAGAEADERLDRVATALASGALLRGGPREQGRGFTEARTRLWEEGVSDAVFAFTQVSFDGTLAVPTVMSAVRDVGNLSRFDRLGVGIAQDDQSTGSAVVLLSRRDAEIEEPGSWAGDGNREIRLWLRPGLKHPRVERIGPDGAVEVAQISSLDDSVYVMIFAGARDPGVHRLEVRARLAGRETLVAIHAARAPGDVPDPDDPEAFVLDMVNAERRRYDLPDLVQLAPLALVARTHSEAMRDGLSFGHVSPATPDVRIATAGIPFSVALENVSRASTLAEAVTLFMASPGHRANVLDPRVTHAGVGVARSEPLTWYVTADLVRWLPPHDDEEIGPRAREVIEASRERPLKSKRALDRIAQRWCDEVVLGGRDHLTEDEVRTLTDEVHFHMRDALRVLVDLAIVEEVEQIGSLPEIHRDEFDQYGLGLVQDDQGGMIHALVILVDRKTQ